MPAQWQAVCAAQRAKPRELKLRVLSWGAAPASDTLLRDMAETFPGTQILAAFGQTEMSPVTCMLLGEDAIRKLGSVGKVIPTVSARVVDEDMNDVPVGQVGEIVYRAPTLMAGYWNNPKATAEAFAGGWFHSGDLVRQDDEGYVWVVDRKKDMIISGGENIYCAEVENVLAAHPSIGEVGGDRPRRTRSGARYPSRSSRWRSAGRRASTLDELDGIPRRTARAVQASEGPRGRRRAAPQPRRQGPQDGTEDAVRRGRRRLTLAKVLLLQRFQPTRRKADLRMTSLPTVAMHNPADAVHRRRIHRVQSCGPPYYPRVGRR